jgi:hypothetical protein
LGGVHLNEGGRTNSSCRLILRFSNDCPGWDRHSVKVGAYDELRHKRKVQELSSKALPILCVNQFAEHDLLRRIANVVHGSRRKPLTGEPHQPYNERRKGRYGKRLALSD